MDQPDTPSDAVAITASSSKKAGTLEFGLFSYACELSETCNNAAMANGVDQPNQGELSVGGFTPLSCQQILDSFDFTPDNSSGKPSWSRYCQMEAGVYEYPTLEFVQGLGNYLTSRMVEMGDRIQGPIRMLEVAAGRGLLSALVAKVIEKNGVAYTSHAVDDGSEPRWYKGESFSETLDFREAIQKYEPHIIIGAWLPQSRHGVNLE